MPRIRPGMKKPPPGFELINDALDAYEDSMKDALQGESLGVMGKTSNSVPLKKRRTEAEVTAPVEAELEKEDKEADIGDQPAEESIPPLWRVAKISHDRTRHVFNACFREKRVSKEVFDYCCEMQFIDGGLARRWKLPGYERLCCTACGVSGSASVVASMTTKFALRNKAPSSRAVRSGEKGKGTCICRVPAHQRENKTFHACAVCGCEGCCSAGTSTDQ